MELPTKGNLGRDRLDSALVDFDPIESAIMEARGHYAPSYTTNNRVLGVWGLTAITYFIGCGGPVRAEPIIAAGGPAIGIPALIVYPLLVTVPYAYIVAELCSAFPEDGGFTIWVLHAFGPFWGFQVGYWSWISGVFKGALLPGLLLQIILDYHHMNIKSSVVEYIIKALIAILLSLPSLLGSKVVERSTLLLLFWVLASTLLFSVWGYINATHYEDLLEIRHESITIDENGNAIQSGPVAVQWGTLLNTLFWAFDGINTASLFGGQVANPAHVYGRAIVLTVGLTFASYIIPMLAAVATNEPNWSMFARTSFSDIAESIGGPTLQNIILVSSLCGVAGLFMTGLYCKSFEMSGMAQWGMLPPFFSRRNQSFDSPHHSILATLGATLILLMLKFDDLLPMTNAFAGAVQIMIIFAVIRLRKELPLLPRPTRAPGGIWVLALMAILPFAVLCYITFGAFDDIFSGVIICAFLLPGAGYAYFKTVRFSA